MLTLDKLLVAGIALLLQVVVPAPTGTASIAGSVIDAGSGAPVPYALVRLSTTTRQENGVTVTREHFLVSDAMGRYVFHDLAAGRFEIGAEREGYTAPAGSTGIEALTVTEAQHVSGRSLRLVRQASISGMIVDEAGEPMIGVRVSAFRRDAQNGIPKLQPVATEATDDRGFYQIDSLPPGAYVLAVPLTQTTEPASNLAVRSLDSNPLMDALNGGLPVSLSTAEVVAGDQLWQWQRDYSDGILPGIVNGRLAAYPTSFFPGVSQIAQATPVNIRSGEDRTGIDWQVRPTGIAQVSGVLLDAGVPAGGNVLRLVPAPGGQDDEALVVARARTSEDGRFTLVGVPPGSYRLRAARNTQSARSAQPGPAAFVDMPLVVGDRDITGLAPAMKRAPKLTGRVVIEGHALTTAQQPKNLAVVFSGFAQPQSPIVAADMTFAASAIQPGWHTISPNEFPPQYVVRAVRIGGVERRSNGFQVGDDDVDVTIVLTDLTCAINGQVRVESPFDLPAAMLLRSDYAAVLDANEPLTTASVRVDETGSFSLKQIAGGDYYLAVVSADVMRLPRDRAFFDAIARAGERVSLAGGDSKVVSLRIVSSIR